MEQKKYQKKERKIVLGIQINLESDGFSYRKWGGEQRCQTGDWLVNNDGNCYTVEKESFKNTYEEVGPAQFIKTAPIWATLAIENGKIKTKEGFSDYLAGDYLVSNNQDGSDAYTIPKDRFEDIYELIEATKDDY